MKSASLLLVAASACLLATPAFAEPKDDVAAAMKALNDAPAYRMKVTTTDGTTKAVNAITVESTNPDGLHMKVESGGTTAMEVYSDGKTALMSKAGGAFEAAPQMAPMIGQLRQNSTMESMIKMAKDMKVVGKDTISGVPATIYTFETDMMGLQGSNKLWVSDKDHRPLKSEGEAHGDMGGQKVDQKILVAYEYDPSLKIVMPAAAK